MTVYLAVAAVSALLVALGRLPALKLFRATALPFACLAFASLGLVAVGLLEVEGSTWETALDVAFLASLAYLVGQVTMLLFFDWFLIRRVGLPVPRLVRDVVSLAVQVALIATVLKAVLGLQLTGLVATSAAITVIIGLSLQQTLGNLLAGIAIAWEGRVRPGEWVRLGDVQGLVVEPGWRSVVLRTTLDERIVIPNSRLTEERITVLGDGRTEVGLEVEIGVAYASPPDEVQRVLRPVLAEVPGVASDPAPQVLTHAMADSAIVYRCRFWTQRPWQAAGLRSEVLTRAHAALARAGMEIPYPQRTVHMAPPQAAVDHQPAIRRALELAELFRELDPAPQAALTGASRLLRFASGEAIVRQGEDSTALYLVVRGEVEVERELATGREVIARLGPGHTFGEVAFLRGVPRIATVRAASPLEVLEVDTEALREMLAEAPEVAAQLAQRVEVLERGAAEADEAAEAASRPASTSILADILRRFGRGA